MTRLLAMFVVFALAGCAAPVDRTACSLPEQKLMVEAQLFFGRNIEGRAPLSDAEWSDFVSSTITGIFPEGFTVTDGEGQWLNPQTHRSVHEQSKIVTVVEDNSVVLKSKLAAVMNSYRTRYNQQSVGVVTNSVCAAF